MINAEIIMHFIDHRDGFLSISSDENVYTHKSIYMDNNVGMYCYTDFDADDFSDKSRDVTYDFAASKIQEWIDDGYRLVIHYDQHPRQMLELGELKDMLR